MTTCYRILLLLSGFQVDKVHILKLSSTGLIFSTSEGELLIKGHWCSVKSWYFHLEHHVSSTEQRSYRCCMISDMKMASASCKMGLNWTAFYPLPPTHRLTWTLQINYASPRHYPPYNQTLCSSTHIFGGCSSMAGRDQEQHVNWRSTIAQDNELDRTYKN